jgi:acetyltransferase-like isoleucine patch superfamily enzyme/dTDP-4-dehydrorhamnose 3,5-epimerase-like enzyme
MTQPYFAHSHALVESSNIGKNTRIWAFAHILPGAVIGEDCNISDQTFIENDVIVGNRVTIKCGAQLWDGVTLEDDVFVGPNVTFMNDLFPRSNHQPENRLSTIVRKGASIGANATILAGINIGPRAMVGAGAVVTHDVPPFAIVVGNPARIRGYVSTTNRKALRSHAEVDQQDGLTVSKAKLIRLPRIVDLRGSLSFGEYDKFLPFVPKRYFVIFDVPSVEVRGEHAHREQHQFLVCLKGSCTIVLDDGSNREELSLNQPDVGLHIHPMIWAIEYKFTQDAILLVLASDIYDEKDYIRDYDTYLRTIKHLNND